MATKRKPTKHTPDPWAADGVAVFALNSEGTNRMWATVTGGCVRQGERTSMDELAANADLMSAAPDLLDALVLLADMMEDNFRQSLGLAGKKAADRAVAEHIPLKQARAAIAKALGKGER